MSHNQKSGYILFFCVLILLTFTLIQPQLFSQEPASTKKTLPVEQTLRVYRLSDLSFSPDGLNLVFTVTEPSPENKPNSDLWLYNLQKFVSA